MACDGIIHFDAVLCRGPRHDPPTTYSQTSSYLPPAIARVALGSQGCKTCKSCPEGMAIFGKSPSNQIPLMAPPPLHDSTIRAAQRPSTDLGLSNPGMIVRCLDCLKSRWCSRCHDWWCESCYMPGQTASAGPAGDHQQEAARDAPEASANISSPSSQFKVHMGICVDECLVNDMVMDGFEL
jgi:hypothetical protein